MSRHNDRTPTILRKIVDRKWQEIDERKVIKRFRYAHPVFTLDGVAAQQRHAEISGQRHTHYCGAYWFNGFHEDGVNSALRVARDFGISL